MSVTRLVTLGLTVLPLIALPVGAEDRETRNLTGFDAIEVSHGIDLHIRQGENFRVEVETSGASASDIITEVDNGTLRIGQRRETFRLFGWFDDSSVDVTLPSLRSLQASGGSDVDTDGLLSGESLRISASGGSDVDIDVAVNELEVEASGGSDTRLTGTAASLRADTSGGSDLSARGLTVDEAILRSSGGSDISITVLERIVARASGGSDIRYAGDPDVVDINASGSADVTRR
jgi:hypothetical protein